MREIKFRGLKKSDKTWIVGDLYRVNGAPFIKNDECHNSPDDYEVIPETVGQFIGKDRNKKEVFEGDKMSNGGVVRYNEEKSMFVCYGTRNGVDYDIVLGYPMFLNELEVVGNIYKTN